MNDFDNKFGEEAKENEQPTEAAMPEEQAARAPEEPTAQPEQSAEPQTEQSAEPQTEQSAEPQTEQPQNAGYQNTGYQGGYYQGGYRNTDYQTQNTYQNGYGYYAPKQPNQPAQGAPNPPTGGKKSGGFRVFCVLLALAVALTVGAGVGYIIGGSGSNTDQFASATSTPTDITFIENKIPTKKGIDPDANGNYTVSQVASLVSPSVVSVCTYSGDTSSSSGTTTTSISSGVIIDKSGYVISNDHIYADIPNAKFVVTLYDNRSYKASFVAGDQKSDICVLKIEGATDLTPASFGESDKVSQGDTVVAIGTPYGMSNSVTSGIISAANRRIRKSATESNSQSSSSTSAYTMRVIQTDTAINHGNSGGALVNLKGQVIGINSSKIVADTYEGMCFAIPSNDAVSVAKNLIANKKVVGRAKLGVSYVEISTASAVVNNVPSGLMLASIDSDSGLYNKGFKENDIICEIDDKVITSADIALDIIADKTAGDTVKLKIYSSSTGKYSTVTVKLLEDQSVSSYKTQSTAESSQNPFKLQPTTTKASAR